MYLRANFQLPRHCRIGLSGFKSTQNRQNHVFMTSSRDCDVTSRDQNFKNYFMAHGKRLSINQYRADLSTVFRLDFISCRRGMGISVSVYYYLYIRRLASLHHDSYSYQLVLERVNTGQRHLGPSRNMLNNTTTQYKQHSGSTRNFRKSNLPAIETYKCTKLAEIAIFSLLITHVPEIVETSIFFWYILRWTRLHKKFFKFLGQAVPEI